MPRQAETSRLLPSPQGPSQSLSSSSSFARPPSTASSSSSSSHFRHKSDPYPPPPYSRPPPVSYTLDADDDDREYSFAPHEHAVLYDGEEDEDGEALKEEEEAEDEEEAPTLKRVDNSAQVNGRGGGQSHPHRASHRLHAAPSSHPRPSPPASLSSSSATTPGYGSTATASSARNDIGRPSFSSSDGASYSSSSSAPPLPRQSPPAGLAEMDDSGGGLLSIKELHPSPPSPHWSASSALSSRPLVLALYLLLSIVIAAANSITWKRTLNRFRAVEGTGNLEFFVTQFTIFLYVLLAAVILAYRWLCTSLITDEQKGYPQQKFAFMGLLDAIAGLASSLGGAFTSGQVQTIINQFNIPATMLLSRSFLHSRYKATQYLGAVLIVAGSLIAALPNAESGGGGEEGGGQLSSATLWYGPLILVIATLPNSLSNVYKEWNFKQDGLDVFFLTTNVSVYQVLLGFLFCPLLSLPGLGGITLQQIPVNFTQGWTCFLGHRLPEYDCHVAPYPYVILLLYVLVNFAYNLLLLLITKHGSALLLVIASALSLPLTNLIFTLPVVMGDEAEEWSWWTASGLFVVLVGFLMYSLVTDTETGDWLPAQGAAGQMIYVVEEPVILQDSYQLLTGGDDDAGQRRGLRRHSFDGTASPLLIADVEGRKRDARRRFLEYSGRKSVSRDESAERLFFTPP